MDTEKSETDLIVGDLPNKSGGSLRGRDFLWDPRLTPIPHIPGTAPSSARAVGNLRARAPLKALPPPFRSIQGLTENRQVSSRYYKQLISLKKKKKQKKRGERRGWEGRRSGAAGGAGQLHCFTEAFHTPHTKQALVHRIYPAISSNTESILLVA